jgi:hypothetical protein
MGDTDSGRESSEDRNSRFFSNRIDGIFRDVYKSPIEDALSGSLNRFINPQKSAIHSATLTSSLMGKVGADALEPRKASMIEALASGTLGTKGMGSASLGLSAASRDLLGLGSTQMANSSTLAGILSSSVNASITSTLAESMPSFTASLGSLSGSLTQTNFTKLDGVLGLGTFNASTFASLGAWATRAGLDEDLLDWSAEVASDDTELESELEAIYALPAVDAETAPTRPSHTEDEARPTTKPLPIVKETDQNFERSVRVGVALVLYLSIAVVSYIATGMYPFWAVFIAGALGRVAPDVENNVTKKIVEDIQEQHEPDDFQVE